MTGPRTALAAPNALACTAGEEVAHAGGNAVDAAIAAMVVACTTEPGICSLGGGGYATVTAPGADWATVDGYVAMPGLGRDGPFDPGIEVHTEYGGGVDMVAGHGSVATPGAPQMLARLHELHGRMPWSSVLEPAVAIAAEGFPIGSASDHYLEFVHDNLYGWHEPSFAALHHDDGSRLVVGDTCVVDHLADTLRAWQEDPATFATGHVADLVVADVARYGGPLGHEDLVAYEPVLREPLAIELDGWRFATNPPPAVGGVVLALLLNALDLPAPDGWRAAERDRFVEAMRAVLAHRLGVLDLAEDRTATGWRSVERALTDGLVGLESSSTCHVSATDADGHAVAITCSSGYGSGVMPPGTGVWMNNCLGEKELVRRGPDGYAPGERLPSNMAPTVGRCVDGRLLAIGSPGADRITSALSQALAGIAGGMRLQDAVDAPRAHVTRLPDGRERIDLEEDVELDDDVAPAVPRRVYAPASMYFGGVAATACDASGRLSAAADPRRDGATVIS